MAFGQQSGPPASARQLKELLGLLEAAGYAGFRDARGPLGFNQRQGGGKFTSAEADAFIEQLQAEAESAEAGGDEPPAPSPSRARPKASAPATAGRRAAQPMPTQTTAAERQQARQARQAGQSGQGTSLRDTPATVLARELERRGWIVIPPESMTTPEPPVS